MHGNRKAQENSHIGSMCGWHEMEVGIYIGLQDVPYPELPHICPFGNIAFKIKEGLLEESEL